MISGNLPGAAGAFRCARVGRGGEVGNLVGGEEQVAGDEEHRHPRGRRRAGQAAGHGEERGERDRQGAAEQ